MKGNLSNKKFKLLLNFTFFIQNLKLPFSFDKNKFNAFKDKAKTYGIEMHFSEHWEEPPSIRRFLWGFFPHLHFKREIKENRIKNLFENSEISIDESSSLSISTVWGGASMAVLEINGSLEKEINEFNFDCLDNFQEPEKDEAHEINQWFVEQINQYVNILKEVLPQMGLTAKDIKWREWSNGKEEYLIGYNKSENSYISILPEGQKFFFYQEPYIVFWVPFEIKDIDVNLKKIENIEKISTSFFGCCPVHHLSRKVYLGGEKKEIERIRQQTGLGEIIIPENILAYFDPSRMIVFYELTLESKEKEARELEIHRALFAARTRMHFCILWEARLQALSQRIYNILKSLPDKSKAFNELKKTLEQINDLSLEISASSSELFNSFIWRYATFLPSRMGHLFTIYNAFDSLLSTSLKTEDMRNYINELRTQLEFAANFAREKIAELFPFPKPPKG